jgi:diacylglycerol O-acyltransferase / wax synthase
MARTTSQNEQLAPVDSAWLRMEHPTNLMMITGVLMFDEQIDIERFRTVIQQRLVQRFERFRKRAIIPAAGNPYWEVDRHFQLDSHIHHIALPAPANRQALEVLVSDLMSSPLDFSKPLWHFHVVDGYGTGSAIIARLHHSIADGIALVYVLLSLTDTSANAVTPPPEPEERKSTPRDPMRQLLRPIEQALQTTRNLGEQALQQGQTIIEHPERLNELGKLGSDGVAALGKLLLMPPDPKTMLKGPLGPQKRAVWSQPIPLDVVKSISKATGATINDILMAAVAGALRQYLLSRGTDVEQLNLRAVVPVNLRPLDRPPTMGNQFGVVFLSLPIGIADAYDRLIEVRERMEAIKGSPEAVVAFGILTTFGVLPQPLQDLGVNMFGTKATAVLTNVPGPRDTMYLAGSAVSGMMFWVPQSGRLGLGISILSYAGQVLVGIAVDAELIPEPEGMITAFEAEIELLQALKLPVRRA